MKVFTGIDILELDRFRAIGSFNRVAEFILSPNERRLMRNSRDRCQFLASRFALKEAVIKALPEPTSLIDLEILTTGGQPKITLLKKFLKTYTIAVSLSHSDSLVAASAVVLLSQ